ncbi:RNA-binding protein NOB1 isoform X1 [Tachysurus vachellii]|uniref:RNA-binding protein NOB1 isoform X1 n=1 Tax=Tachysurus vachellii TaxID=175792 RepID=UPI00296B0F09|nr:RNA-binding protein NOB1 isoform X1 [Tachysurus vachellii]
MVVSMVEHVVADAGAFLKNAALHEIGKNIYTLKDVVNEIRDKQTKKNLAFLPYKLNFKEPFPEHVRFVTEFAKKTGDYPSLSATDIKVLALTYQLELENCGAAHLKKEPAVQVEVHSTQRHPEAPVNIAGFHLPSKQKSVASSANDDQQPAASRERGVGESSEFNSFQYWRDPIASIDDDLLKLVESSESSEVQCDVASREGQIAESSEFNSFQFWRDPLPSIDDELLKLCDVTEKVQRVDLMSRSTEHEDDDGVEEREAEDEDGDEDGGGWITPSNIKQIQMDAAEWCPPENVSVGCLTTDFAMQNVLIQIGLKVLSVNGMLIKHTRNYILRCHACFKTTTNMNKAFCPHCGNNTLKKVAVTLGQDGSTRMHFSNNPKVLNPRGKRYAVPLPQGGKHSSNPHLVDDQRFPQQRLSRKARVKTDVFDPDYLAGGSPFSEHDIYSRAAGLHLRDAQCGGGRRRANPNASRKKSGKKK